MVFLLSLSLSQHSVSLPNTKKRTSKLGPLSLELLAHRFLPNFSQQSSCSVYIHTTGPKSFTTKLPSPIQFCWSIHLEVPQSENSQFSSSPFLHNRAIEHRHHSKFDYPISGTVLTLSRLCSGKRKIKAGTPLHIFKRISEVLASFSKTSVHNHVARADHLPQPDILLH